LVKGVGVRDEGHPAQRWGFHLDFPTRFQGFQVIELAFISPHPAFRVK
jgi:hypothetical protein